MASPRKKRTMSVAHSQQLPKNCVNDKMLSIIEHEGSFLGVELCQRSWCLGQRLSCCTSLFVVSYIFKYVVSELQISWVGRSTSLDVESIIVDGIVLPYHEYEFIMKRYVLISFNRNVYLRSTFSTCWWTRITLLAMSLRIECSLFVAQPTTVIFFGGVSESVLSQWEWQNNCLQIVLLWPHFLSI